MKGRLLGFVPMASLSLQKEGRQRSLKEQQRQIYEDDSEDNLSQTSEGMLRSYLMSFLLGFSWKTALS